MAGSNNSSSKSTNSNASLPMLKFVMQGPRGCGKTSFLRKLKNGAKADRYIASQAIEIHFLALDSTKMHAWDCIGRGSYRPMSLSYYFRASGIIYMIDSSSDTAELDESLEHLNNLLQYEDMPKMTVMVAANKQDLGTAVSPEVVENKIKEKCKIGPNISLFVMPLSVLAEDDSQMQLAYRTFVKKIKSAEDGRFQSGLIPHAWESATEEMEDSEVIADCEEEMQGSSIDKHNDDDCNATENEQDLSIDIHENKKSLPNDVFEMFKSILVH